MAMDDVTDGQDEMREITAALRHLVTEVYIAGLDAAKLIDELT
jgi:hypothetical protein